MTYAVEPLGAGIFGLNGQFLQGAQVEAFSLVDALGGLNGQFLQGAQVEAFSLVDALGGLTEQPLPYPTIDPGRTAMANIITRKPDLLTPFEVGETDVLNFDYTDSLTAGETISSAVVTISVISGTDASPSAMKVGGAQAATPYALQKITGGVRNTTYLCYCAATTSAGRVLVNAGILPVIAFGQP